MNAHENPPAFPQPKFDNFGHGDAPDAPGMSLRDWFAGQALASIMQDRNIWDCNENERHDVARRMFQWADAMLAARGDHP
jgi:hypothetical protein